MRILAEKDDIIWVIFFDDPMKYICGFDQNGKMIKPADSLKKLNRIQEFEEKYKDAIKRI